MRNESNPVSVLARRSRAEAGVRRVTPGLMPSRAEFCDRHKSWGQPIGQYARLSSCKLEDFSQRPDSSL